MIDPGQPWPNPSRRPVRWLRRVVSAWSRRDPRTRAPRRRRVLDVDLVVAPHVFDPVRFRTGLLLAQAVAEEGLPLGDVLDLGCGAGLAGLVAARRGARVVAADVNPAATACASANAARNGLSVEVLTGDLFAPVAGRRFDRVLANPPYFRGQPRDDGDRAWRSDEVIPRLAAGLSDHLQPHGALLVALTTEGACSDLLRDLQARGFRVEVALRRSWFAEVATVWRVSS